MHLLFAVVASLVVGGVLGYAFRGKEHSVIEAAGAEAKAVEGEVKSKL
jgi:hypothetical protein